MKVVTVDSEGEERDEVRREYRVYPRTRSQGDGREDGGERDRHTRHRRHTLPKKEQQVYFNMYHNVY